MPYQNCQAENVVNLNLVKRKIFDDFNVFHHQDLPTTNPLEQQKILLAVRQNSKELTSTERDILLIIVENTVCKSFYYTFMTHKEIAEECGCSTKSVQRTFKRLKELKWIATKKSEKYTCKTCIDFNVGKIMPLGAKGSNRTKCPAQKKTGGQNVHTEENYTYSSNEEYKSSTDCATIKNPKSKKSLMKTWNNALKYSDFADKASFLSLLTKDYHKLTSLIGNEHIWKEGDNRKKIVGKWPDSPQKLHECMHWSVRYWRFIKHRLGKSKFPNYPDIGWFVSCIKEIYALWLSECGDELDEKVILMKEKIHAEEMRKKWAKHEF